MRKSVKSALAAALCGATALAALPSEVAAGPMGVASPTSVALTASAEKAYHRGYRGGYYRRGYGRYGAAAGIAGAAALGAGLAGASGYGYPAYGYGGGYGYGAYGSSAPLMTAPSVAADGMYCATPVKTCLLYEPGWLGTGCSCRVPGGHARGTVE
jgi:hypothetical protein